MRISKSMLDESMMNYSQWGLNEPQYEACPECDDTGSVQCPECVNISNAYALECDACHGSKQIACEICILAANEIDCQPANEY